MCFPSERIVQVYTQIFDTSGCTYLLPTNSEVYAFGYNRLFMFKYYYLGFTGL